jgi:hypothetical protein
VGAGFLAESASTVAFTVGKPFNQHGALETLAMPMDVFPVSAAPFSPKKSTRS